MRRTCGPRDQGRRADLLSALRREAKAAAYLALSSQCWYVLRAGIAALSEVPAAYGVMLADDAGLNVVRPAPRRAMRLPLAVWMALARATPEAASEDNEQARLVEADSALHLAPRRPTTTKVVCQPHRAWWAA